ncbi:MAG: 8-oxo-dGTP diphosphatase [Frankiaceae bacterium]|nr:8-oxo-dGTP diphosphatase [Frankiaceae bacterium]
MSMDAIVVVAAAIVAPGPPPRVLAAQRAYPESLAGQWELPGGKVEPGETDIAALVRECREEFGVSIVVLDRVGVDLPAVDPSFVLRVWWARVVAGEPRPHQHSALRWLAADEHDEVAWLPADRPHVVPLRAGLVDWRG